MFCLSSCGGRRLLSCAAFVFMCSCTASQADKASSHSVKPEQDACGDAAQSAHGAGNHARAYSAVTAVLNMQADAWNRGDLDTFLSGYVKGPEISYVSGSSEVWGYEALQERYKNRYGDKHDTMGTLKFSHLKVQDLGSHNALCIGHWHLERSEKPPVEGIFSLVLVHTSAGWKIMHDHTSVSESPASKT